MCVWGVPGKRLESVVCGAAERGFREVNFAPTPQIPVGPDVQMGSLHMRVTKGADIEAQGGCLEAGGGSQGRELALGMCRDGVAGPRGGERR